MEYSVQDIEVILSKKESTPLRIRTLGHFAAWLEGEEISPKAWGRDKTVQLFEYLVTIRHRTAMHKEQIIYRLWEDADSIAGNRDFKVALHGINKTLEPDRKSRSEPIFVLRQGLTYFLNRERTWIDADAFEELVQIGNKTLSDDSKLSKMAFEAAIPLYQGEYLPDRLFEDWTSAERERLQVIALGAMITLAELTLTDNPLESIRLAQQALMLDHTWEDAYRVQMRAYQAKGNRPLAIKTYRQCEKVLAEEFGISPLPETKTLYQKILA